MRLVFDLRMVQPLGGTKYHGGGIYGEILFSKLIALDSKRVCGYYDSSKYIDSALLELVEVNGVLLYDSNLLTLEEVAFREGKVIYSPIFLWYLLGINSNIKIISTIHGLRDLECPVDSLQYEYLDGNSKWKSFFYKIGGSLFKREVRKYRINTVEKLKYRRLGLHSNLKFITVSNHSKFSLLAFIPSLSSNNIEVYYSPSTVNSSKINNLTHSNKYYLLVSGNRWHKNSLRAIMAFDKLFSERPDFNGFVYITGLSSGDFLNYQIINVKRFKFLGYVSKQELHTLYSQAYLFVYPSLNEGFGYPPLEAMSLGTPVIASGVASIPEVCGDSVLYFNPFSVNEIKIRILQMEDYEIRNYYISRGFARFKDVKLRQDLDLDKLCFKILSSL
ncbi:glycosyltransferase family 4 protein [Algoriphagus winogradskyi]|uniref:Glycosyltransferase involved in cell wall bisynthesis n=1 Tax=Algoriphagus winogradskyi TaxID=237017 RepID=A0ABY1PFQ8_9BACT|nr:glycosyltransferase family 1 protein [Algoriphagus winogradskyi]SMP33411.1 Glycosyltransferase involved in cell wall bisynthesis [Algoriphagus winogradskyi]